MCSIRESYITPQVSSIRIGERDRESKQGPVRGSSFCSK